MVGDKAIDTLAIAVKRWLTTPFGLVALAFGLRLLIIPLTSGLEYDITSYHIQAQSIFNHQNIYLVTNRYPYPPVWIWWTALAQWLSTSAPLPFDWLIKVPALLGDCLIVALLRRYHGVSAALFYAANPVAILVTGGQGQFDGLVIALVVLAWACWRSQHPLKPYWAALALGGAIALKGYPILLVPALLAKLTSNRQRALAAGLSLAPLLLSICVYSVFFGLAGAMVSRVLIYNSPLNFGWALYVPFLMNLFWPAGFPAVMLALAVMARAAILLLACRLPFRRPDWSLAYGWAIILLSLYVLAPGISAQYLLWVLPFLALIDLPWGWRYSLCSALTLWLFYVAVYPGSVPWGAALRSMHTAFWFPCFVALNLVWWLFCLMLWRRLLWSGRKSPPGEERTRQRAEDHVRAASAT
jgi:hypothetical protein